MENIHIIYHHGDLDGEASAVVIGDHLKNSMNIGSIRTYRKNYSDDFNNHQFFCNDIADLTLWFVDLSFNNKTKDKMIDIIKNYNGNHLTINWIDHHQSSLDCGQVLYDSIQNYLKEKNKTNITINFILDNNLSGAGLCYAYSYLQHNLNLTDNSYILKDFIIPDKDHYRSYKEIIAAVFRTMVHIHIPLFIYHVDNYDRWTGDDYDADAFNLGTKYYGYKLRDGIYADIPDIYKNWSNDEECDIDNIIHYGRICYNYTMARYKSEKSYIGHTKINQFKVAYKVGTGNSWNFEDDMMNPQNADCAILVKFLPEKNIFEYSIYASDETKNYVQCNKIAEAFGGGGHIGAAGFMNKDFLFIQDDIDSYIKTNYPDAYAEFAPHVESKDSYNN